MTMSEVNSATEASLVAGDQRGYVAEPEIIGLAAPLVGEHTVGEDEALRMYVESETTHSPSEKEHLLAQTREILQGHLAKIVIQPPETAPPRGGDGPWRRAVHRLLSHRRHA